MTPEAAADMARQMKHPDAAGGPMMPFDRDYAWGGHSFWDAAFLAAFRSATHAEFNRSARATEDATLGSSAANVSRIAVAFADAATQARYGRWVKEPKE